MLNLVVVPTTAEIIGNSSTGATYWASSFLPEFWIIIEIALGMFIVGLLVSWLINTVKSGLHHAFEKDTNNYHKN